MDKEALIDKLGEIKGEKEGSEQAYVQEIIEVVDNECWRSSIVLGWGLFMHHLYLKIEEYSLEAFAEKTKERNLEVGYLNQPNDLTEIKDSEVLITSKELSILPPQLEDQLKSIQLRKRNNCAHFGSHTPSENSVFEFFSEIFDAIEKLENREFEERETEFLEEIREMPADKIEDLPVEGTRTRNAVNQIKEELLFIENERDYEVHKNYLHYLKYIIEETEDEDILEICLNTTIEIVHSKVYSDLRKNSEKILTTILKRKKAKEIVSSDENQRQRIITGFANSGSYRQAERRMRWIIKVDRVLDEEDWNKVAQATAQNRQIYQARKCKRLLPNKLSDHSDSISQGTLDDLESIGSPWENVG